MMNGISLSESLPDRRRWRPVSIKRCYSQSSKVLAKSSVQQNKTVIYRPYCKTRNSSWVTTLKLSDT